MTVLVQNQFHENRFQCLWWAQDGAPCRGLLAMRGTLNQIFGERLLNLKSLNTEWPPVFRIPPESLNVLRQRMITECNLLRENRDLIRRSVQYMRSRADTYIQRGGSYVEGNL